MTAMASPRPKLQTRAITELGPLFNPVKAHNSHQNLGEGTRAAVGGSRVTGGARLPGGAFAPVSPFLPMPPAPTAEELSAADREEANRTPVARPSLSKPMADLALRRASSNTAKPGHAPPMAAGMIRSYSLPVATQTEFEAQCQAFNQREIAEPGCHSFLWSSGWPASSTFPTNHQPQKRHMSEFTPTLKQRQHARKPLSPLALNHGARIVAPDGISPESSLFPSPQLPTHLELQDKVAATAVPELPDCDNSIIQHPYDDDSYFAPHRCSEASDSSSDACSDGPATPKASTPDPFSHMQHSLSKHGSSLVNAISDGDDALDEDFIHPDHLAPPSLAFS